VGVVEDPDDNPLEFITDDELFEELALRSSGVVLVWQKSNVEGEDVVRFRYSGGLATAIGLASIAKVDLLSEFTDDSE
jgi:hypothetical protein